MNLASPKLEKHQYFHVPAHVARRHCLVGNIDEPDAARRLRRCAPRFFNCRVVDATGIEPVHPRSTTSSWEFEGQACASCDSFPDYRLGNQNLGADGHPLLTRGQRVSDAHPNRLKATQRLPKRFSFSARARLAASPIPPAWRVASCSFRTS